MITKVKGGWIVRSHKGRRLSKPMSRTAAEKRLRQIEYFKHQKRDKV